MSSAPAVSAVDRWKASLQRLCAFAESGGSAPFVWEATKEVEAAAELAVATPVVVDDDFVSLCMELLEERLPVTSPATRAVLMLLANLCLTDENRSLASDFGLHSTCVLLLQQHNELPTETLFYIFDLMSTMAASDGRARQNMRPAIPYVLASLRGHSSALDVLFGGSFLLSTLAMLDPANCDVIVQRDGLQVLVNAYAKADEVLGGKDGPAQGTRRPASRAGSAAAGVHTRTLQAQKREERVQLAEGAKRWSKDALLKVCRGATPAVDVREKLNAIDYGTFGQRTGVDALKWDLLTGQKKTLAAAKTTAAR